MATPVAQILITLDDAGQVKVEGAIDNKMAAFGLLEVAKESVSDYHKQAQHKVQPAGMGDLALIRGGK